MSYKNQAMNIVRMTILEGLPRISHIASLNITMETDHVRQISAPGYLT